MVPCTFAILKYPFMVEQHHNGRPSVQVIVENYNFPIQGFKNLQWMADYFIECVCISSPLSTFLLRRRWVICPSISSKFFFFSIFHIFIPSTGSEAVFPAPFFSLQISSRTSAPSSSALLVAKATPSSLHLVSRQLIAIALIQLHSIRMQRVEASERNQEKQTHLTCRHTVDDPQSRDSASLSNEHLP